MVFAGAAAGGSGLLLAGAAGFAVASAANKGGKTKFPAPQPQPLPPTRQDPEIAVAKQEISDRERLRKGRAASNVTGDGFLESANIFTPTLKDTTG